MQPQAKLLFRPDELARAVDVKTKTIYRWVRLGQVRHIHCGKYIRIPREEFMRVLREGLAAEPKAVKIAAAIATTAYPAADQASAEMIQNRQ